MPQPYEETSRQAYLAELLNDSSIDCVIAMDTSLNITSWNKACESHTGKLKSAVLGKKLTDIFPEFAASKALNLAFVHALDGLKSFVPVEAGSAAEEYMETHVIPLKTEREQVIGVLIVRHDVAHRQKAEEELKRLNKALAQKAKESDQLNAELIAFAKVTSQDLKEPLHKIRIFSRMLLERAQERLSDNSASLITRIERSAKRAETLTDDIFAFWQVQKPSEPMGEVDLALVLKITLHHFSKEIREEAVVMDSDKLPHITGHRTLIQQLFQHIIENALKFRQPGNAPHITIRTGNKKGKELNHSDAIAEANYTGLSFADNGTGFEGQYADRVFELFQRLNSSQKYSGNGIGLSLCKKIMELHNGFISADSAKGKGCRITCYFPV